MKITFDEKTRQIIPQHIVKANAAAAAEAAAKGLESKEMKRSTRSMEQKEREKEEEKEEEDPSDTLFRCCVTVEEQLRQAESILGEIESIWPEEQNSLWTPYPSPELELQFAQPHLELKNDLCKWGEITASMETSGSFHVNVYLCTYQLLTFFCDDLYRGTQTRVAGLRKIMMTIFP